MVSHYIVLSEPPRQKPGNAPRISFAFMKREACGRDTVELKMFSRYHSVHGRYDYQVYVCEARRE